jgi:hypothetical protein
MRFNDLLNFEKLVTPSVIKVVYWLGVAVLLIWAVVGFLGGLFAQNSIIVAVISLVGAAIGLLLWRVMCELYIVIFGMFERLGDIRNLLSQR